jgi:flagellar basal body P-ring formation protein FlgA
MIRKLAITLGLIALFTGPALGDAPIFRDGNVRIVVPARDIARGATISESDLTYVNVPGAALMSGTITSFDGLKGMEARRMLHAGESLRTDDVRHPVLVSKGQTVTMTFDAPGVDLSAIGRAMSEGGIGDTVTVQNPASFRMITAVVTAAGTVRATGPLSPVLASNSQHSTR